MASQLSTCELTLLLGGIRLTGILETASDLLQTPEAQASMSVPASLWRASSLISG